MTSRLEIVAALALLSAALSPSAGAASAAPAFEGKAVVYGKSYQPKFAWMVRGASSLSPDEVKTYVILSVDDVSEKIRKCEDVTCAVWDAVTNGLVLECDDKGFWVLVLDPERKPSQHSGPSVNGSGWTETAHTADHIAGKLVWRPMNGNPMFDFQVNAALLKAWGPAPKK